MPPDASAACMSSPRLRTSRSASPKASAPPATRAVNSPRECPSRIGSSAISPCARNARCAAMLVAKIAGCAFAVRSSSAAGPSQQSARRSNPSVSFASS